MKIHIIISYSWPDYEVEGVFLDEKDADEFMTKHDESGYTKETWEPNTFKIHIDNFHHVMGKIGWENNDNKERN